MSNLVSLICGSCGGKFTAPNGTGITTCSPCNSIFINAVREFMGLDKMDKRVCVPKNERSSKKIYNEKHGISNPNDYLVASLDK